MKCPLPASPLDWRLETPQSKIKKNASICDLFGVARVVATEYLPGSLRGRD